MRTSLSLSSSEWHVTENSLQSVCAPISLTPMKSATLWIACLEHQKANLPLWSQLDWAMMLAQTHCISLMQWVSILTSLIFKNKFLHFSSCKHDYHKWHFGTPCPLHGHLRKRWSKWRIRFTGAISTGCRCIHLVSQLLLINQTKLIAGCRKK